MDPQKKIWRGDPGHKYKLKNNKSEYRDSFTPFVFADPCSLETKQNYPGTLIRFPLRNEQSELSVKLYTTAKLKLILKALKDDASVLLLFLRYIEKIEVFTINTSGFITKLFSVQTDKATERVRKSLKDAFFTQVKQFHSNPSALLPTLQYEVTISVQDIEVGTHTNHQWIVANWVGSKSKQILEASQTVCSLPWLGLAASVNSQNSSRLFCFLPMPDSEEVNPPLPVCVHGTFGLTKDRRHLKWKTSDMQNDNGALWNDLLLSELFPFCYAKFLNVLRDKCDPNMFYSFWPSVSIINQTNWRVALRPLLSLLLQDQLFWSRNGSWVKLQSSVYVVPQMNSGQFPQVVINALIKCGKVVVVLADRVWEAVQFMHTSAYPFTLITSSLVRQALKSNSASYVSMSRVEKFQLLHYCLEDNNYYDLPGLVLLPLVNNTFVAFGTGSMPNKVYTCSTKFLQTRLLANNEALLVNVESEDNNLHQKLIQVANSNRTHLKTFKVEDFAMLLKQLSPFSNGWCSYGSSGGFYNENWLKTFWTWVSAYSLYYFISIPLLPVCNEKDLNRFRIVALQNKSNSRVIKYNKNVNNHPELISATGKLGCHLTCSDEFQFLYHSELNIYVHDLTSSSVLNISSQTAYQNVVFTQEEATALRHFLFQYHVSLSAGQQSVVLHLCIFPAIQNNSLYSLQRARCYVAGRSAAMLISEPECLNKYLFCILQTPLITCERGYVGNLQSMLPGGSWRPTKLQVILYVILSAIENNQISRQDLLKFFSIILEPSEYHSLTTGPEGSQFINKLKSFKFVPTSPNSGLCLPSETYDQTDYIITELFAGQNVFPIAPFSNIHFAALRELGMKSSVALGPPDIIKVTQIICRQSDIQREIKRANKLLEFLSSYSGNRLLNTYHNRVPLCQNLCTTPWLPVMVDPPKGYPKCLSWEGATGNHFVSAQCLYASGSPEVHRNLPCLIGSQIKILHHEGSYTLSPHLLTSFNISQNIPLDAMIKQFSNMISHSKDIERSKYTNQITLLYNNLNVAAINNSYSQYWQPLGQSEVVEVSENKFVQPSLVVCSFDDKSLSVGRLEPYLYILPNHLQQYRKLFCHIGAKEQATTIDVLDVIEKISTKPNGDITQCLQLVTRILNWLCINFTEVEIQQWHERILIPINNSTQDRLFFKPASKVAFLDEELQWLSDDKESLRDIIEDYYLVHPSVGYNMACTLQLKPLNTMMANAEEFCFEQHGQSEPLTTRLNRILREYKDTSVIQELLQNADDAEATEVAVYYDTREHDSSNLLFPGMANSYGPALLFYNNAEFTEGDFENITKIAGETKINKLLKIGKFGIGFCSVYHITDVPSFISGENFIVFDPTLQCLQKEIKSVFNPGIKINFHKHRLLKNKSNQLVPYGGVHNFNPKQRFQGTIFRFPLRFQGSEVSENVFTEEKLLSMIEMIKENSSKLLMFLNNVKKLSFYKTNGNGFTKEFEVSVTKQLNHGNVATCKVSTIESSRCTEESWLIATNSQWFQMGYSQQMGTASVSVKLQNDEKYQVESVKGECFCFLPLNIETGLPVHVSSNFAVMTNRRGIWKADNIGTATKESNWNKMLMETVVFQAYVTLLLHLQKIQQNGLLVNYTFHCLWPFDLMELNPWECLVNKFYTSLLSNEHPLFYSEIAGSWKKLNECNFLSTKILSIGFDDNLKSSLHQVAAVLSLPVVEIPKNVLDRFSDNNNFKACLINEEQFVKYFYNDDTLSNIAVDAKNEIVAASLIVYANNRHCPEMPELMKATKCIPCSPDGKVFKKPIDIVDPTSKIAKLFSLEDDAFPHGIFLSRNTLLTQALSNLGLMQFLSWTLLIERAKLVQIWYHENNKEALNRLVILIECIKENCSSQYPDKDTEHQLQKIAFLPVMQKPQHYPISWKGDTMAKFLSGPELTLVSSKEDSVNAVYACGSQVLLLDLQVFPYSLRHLSNNILKLLGIGSEIKVIDVINHFNELLQWFENCSQNKIMISSEMLQVTNKIAMSVYQYLGKKLNSMKEDNNFLQQIALFSDKACVWNGKDFLLPDRVSFNWKTNGPYLYRFPEILEGAIPLMKKIGIKEDFPSHVLINALCEMKQYFGDSSLSDECCQVVRLIVPKLKDVPKDTETLLPDTQFILRSVKEIKYNDAKWCAPDQEYLYCHEFVERSVAIHLGVEPVKSILLKDHDITDDDGEEFGQAEELTQRLNNILRDYPRDITFLKELLQNADDAGAKKLYIILDKRTHGEEKVISEEWKELQGPALLFWNDSSFSEEDLKGIQKIGLGSKRDDPDKIGQYGIGFNVVYHFTDCPSFVTNDRLCILDPHYYYIAHNKRMKPGRMYKDLDKIWNRFPDMESSYLLNDLDEFPPQFKNGSLFRLPLRLTRKAAKESKIVEDTAYFDLKKLEGDLKRWIPQMREALLFVHNVCDIRLYVIDDSRHVGIMQWDDPHPVSLFSHVESVKGKKKIIKECSNANLVMYNMKLANKQTNTEDKWHIQLGEGNIENSSLEWNTLQPSGFEGRPRHGIAFPVEVNCFNGKSFCFLPMPDYTKLPVHVHGQFVLNSDRRCLWISSNDNDNSSTSDAAHNPDKKEIWNRLLIEAIAVSYVYYLENCVIQSKPKPINDEGKSKQLLKKYYNLFPKIDEASSKHWKDLAICVYNTLSERNSPILASLVENNPTSDDTTSSGKDKDKKYSIEWCKLHLPEESNEGYFHNHPSHQPRIYRVLKIIGMNLLDTPLFIHEQFKQVEITLPCLSKQVALEYYVRFHDDILNHNDLPCEVTKTRFCNSETFIQFVNYLSIHDINKTPSEVTDLTPSSQVAIDNVPAVDLQNVALLMTVNENIHCLSDGIKIINSSNWKLFVNSQDTFLHEGLKYKFKDSHYLFHPSKQSDGYDLIYSVFNTNLPQSWAQTGCAPLGDIEIEWVKNLLECISRDEMFKCFCHKLLSDFALIPADNGTMFSMISSLLPMKLQGCDSKLEVLFKKLQIPFVDSVMFGSVLSEIGIQLPTTARPNDILKCIYLIGDECYNKLTALNNDELTCLFTVFNLIPFNLQEDAVMHISKLPIFTSINDKLVDLSSFSTVWIWNNAVCKAGIKKWITCIPNSVLFLHPSAPWRVLRSQAESLAVNKISMYEVYYNYIFPHFHTMDSATRLKHIKFISKNVFTDCQHESEYTKSPNYYQAKHFISQFKSLKCIGDDTDLRDIQSFYDHTQEIFRMFCNEHCFLPKELQDDRLQDCLKFFGLRTVPTTSDFLDYCHMITQFDQTSIATNASNLLLKTLFRDDIEYQLFHDQSFLQQVSRIPIAIVPSVATLNAIKSQKLGECTITDIDGSKTVTITKLSRSAPLQLKESLWTCKPLIELPISYHDATSKYAKKIKALNITVVPSVNDVIENLQNLTDSEFADFSRFHIQISPKTAQTSSELPGIIVKMICCLDRSVKRELYDCDRIKLQLENLNFVPVKLQMNGYVLVKPIQVLLMDPSTLAPYYPFLHPLISEVQPVFSFLSQIGVKMSLDFSHMKLVFKLAKELCQDRKVNINIKRTVAKATVELTMLLRNAENREQVQLQPLYLLNEQDVLTECSKLIVFDVCGSRPALPPEFTYLNTLRSLPVAKHWNYKELLQLLPKEVGLKSLKSIMQHKMINGVQTQTPHSYVQMIEQILRSDIFKIALEMYASYCTQTADPPEVVKGIVNQFQNNLAVEYLDELHVKPQLHVNNKVIPLQVTLSQDFFLQFCDAKFILSLKNISHHYSSQVFRKLANQLVSILQLKETKCFEFPEDGHIPDLATYAYEILNCGSVAKVSEVIQESLPGCDEIEQDAHVENSDPVLGEVIPQCKHYALDQNMFNYFVSQEWVGYEIEDNKIVYAQVLHCNEIQESGEDLQWNLRQKYTITIGNDTIIEATVLQLYKLIHAFKEETIEYSNSMQMKVQESGDSVEGDHEKDTHVPQATERKTIREAVKAAWSLPEEERRKAIKRLFLQYHPDKNPGNPYATANFQLLQEEIDRMERGISEEEFDAGSQAFRNPSSHNSGWSGWYNQWSQTASSHRKHQSRHRSRHRSRGTSARGMSGGWNVPKPQKDIAEAKRWIKQAEYDYTALSVLNAASDDDEKACASACFMSHEVAEKSLKAGMYAKCGIGKTTLKNPNIVHPACALVQEGCPIDIADAIFLEKFFSDTRYPYCYPPPIVPGEKYLSSTAREAFLAATRIYEAMKQLIEEEE